MENPNLVLAFSGGLAAFISPCVLPMIPVYFAALVGPEFLDHSKIATVKRSVFFLHSVAFITGFGLVFTLLGIIAGFTGSFISPDEPVVRNITGSILLIFGLYMLAAARFPSLNFEKRLNITLGSEGYVRSFLTGAVFTFAWTPCVGPILGSILTLAIAGENTAQAGGLLFAFSLGMGIPFIVIGLFIGSALPLIRRINRYTFLFYIAGGFALAMVGVLILTGTINIMVS